MESAGEIGLDIIVIDNASTDGSPDMVARDFPSVHLIRNTANVGFAAGNNQGIRAAGDAPAYFVLLNSDTIVKPGTLAALARFMDAHPNVGAAAPRLVRPDGTPQPFAFGRDPTLGYLLRRGLSRMMLRRDLHNWSTAKAQRVDWVSGACMVVRRTAVDQVGSLDEDYFMYFEDNDWCLRMRIGGWQVWYVPDYEVIHLGGQSLKHNPAAQQAYYKSLELFYAKHYPKPQQWVLSQLLKVFRAPQQVE